MICCVNTTGFKSLGNGNFNNNFTIYFSNGDLFGWLGLVMFLVNCQKKEKTYKKFNLL